MDKAKRKEYLLEAQRILLEERPSVYILVANYVHFTQPYVKGYQYVTIGAAQAEFAEVWLDN